MKTQTLNAGRVDLYQREPTILPFYQKKKYAYLVVFMSRLEYITHDKNRDKRFTGALYNYDNGPFKNKECEIYNLNGWQLAKMKKSIPDMSLPWIL